MQNSPNIIQTRELAELHLQAGNLPQAIALLHDVLSVNSSHAPTLAFLSEIALHSGDAALALDYAQRVTKADRQHPGYQNLLGRALRANGNYAQSAAAYRRAIQRQPDQPEHYIGLGISLRAAGLADEALRAYRRAMAQQPDMAEPHHNIGNLLVEQGDMKGAEESYLRALACNPNLVQAHFELGNLAKVRNDVVAARQCYEAATTLRPDYADAWVALGTAHAMDEREDDALHCYETAALTQPSHAEAHYCAGLIHHHRGNYASSASAFRSSLAAKLDQPECLTRLGAVLRELGQHDEAKACLLHALESHPDLAESHFNLGIVHYDLTEFEDAVDCFTSSIELRPAHALSYLNLGANLCRLNRIAEAEAAAKKSAELDPGEYRTYGLLGNIYMESGLVAKGLQLFEQGIAASGGELGMHVSRCMAITYCEGDDPARILDVHREYALACPTIDGSAPLYGNVRDPNRRMRIGYVSPDFRSHSVAHFIEPVLACHDALNVDIVGYYNHTRDDPITERLRSYCKGGWVRTIGMNDEQLADRIREDEIDILVDLAGHTNGSRINAFIRRPAPVQVTYLGYLTTTGFDAIGHRITDAWVDPDGYEAWAVEKPVRLPGGHLCYRPPENAPPVGPLPSANAGYITFGSFNALKKLSPALLVLWAKVLLAVPGSRLLLKTLSLADESVCDQVRQRFAEQGIPAHRLELVGWENAKTDHLALYNRVDIALDTWPYNGVTTTCEALWMGVPVISRYGPAQASRMGLTLLKSIGLDQHAHDHDDGYVNACASLASDPELLATLRRELRSRMASSPLMDESGFTHRLEDAYRTLWKQWCEVTH